MQSDPLAELALEDDEEPKVPSALSELQLLPSLHLLFASRDRGA
jgi:hypothetical protein